LNELVKSCGRQEGDGGEGNTGTGCTKENECQEKGCSKEGGCEDEDGSDQRCRQGNDRN
jgi:hypothetical protein